MDWSTVRRVSFRCESWASVYDHIPNAKYMQQRDIISKMLMIVDQLTVRRGEEGDGVRRGKVGSEVF